MGDKSDKRRPGRVAPRVRKPAPEVLDLPRGVRVQIDPAGAVMLVSVAGTGYVAEVSLADYRVAHTERFDLDAARRNLITAVVLDALGKRGLAPADPLDLHDHLFR